MIIEFITEFFNEVLGGLTYKSVLIVLAIILVLFLLLRELYTWYWKINRLVKNQKIQNELLNEILTQLKKDK